MRVMENPGIYGVRTVSGLSQFPSTRLATGIGPITREVMTRGAAVITKHEKPVMVLLSLERYRQMEKAATPNLDALARQFDEAYAGMQAPGVAEKTLSALDLGSRQGKTRKRARLRQG